MPAAKFKKGDLARVVHPAGTPEPAWYMASRINGVGVYTASELKEMWRDAYYQGLDDAGESKLVPRTGHWRLEVGDLVTVVRARARPPERDRFARGFVLVCSTRHGRDLYVREKFLEHIQ
jgi:hypothetical protein